MRPIRRAALVAGLAILTSAQAAADRPSPAVKPPDPATLAPSPALMRAVNEAWETLDPARAAPFYDRRAARVFFDVAPLEYRGWTAYAAGASEALRTMRSMRITLLPGAAVRVAGATAWGTATMRYDLTPRDGAAVSRDARWTVIWEKVGGRWLIVHEHVSFADAPPA